MKVLGMIKRTIRYEDMRVMLSLYKSLVTPHVEYCISAWNPHYKKDKELIEKVQRRFTHTHTRLTALFPGLPG